MSPSEPTGEMTYARATINLPGYPHGSLVPIDAANPSPYVAACLAEGILELDPRSLLEHERVEETGESTPTGVPTIVSKDESGTW